MTNNDWLGLSKLKKSLIEKESERGATYLKLPSAGMAPLPEMAIRNLKSNPGWIFILTKKSMRYMSKTQ
jgi:hypothetical protein